MEADGGAAFLLLHEVEEVAAEVVGGEGLPGARGGAAGVLAGEGEEGVAVVFDGARGGAAFDFEIGEEVEDERIWWWGLVLGRVGGGTLGRGFPGWH